MTRDRRSALHGLLATPQARARILYIALAVLALALALRAGVGPALWPTLDDTLFDRAQVVLELICLVLLLGLAQASLRGAAAAGATETPSPALQAERAFERVFRAARDVQRHPDRHVNRLGQLLSELFQPQELMRSGREVERATLVDGGRGLLLPVPALTGVAGSEPATLMLRGAHGGQRRFSREDARRADRLVEQLAAAVAHDLAVERGRTEERLRIAQDLHDDIGARLLTLMYQAPNAEMEDYLRHTLKDLKTLTRGLAAGPQRLSEAAVEWKADVASRLGAAGLALDFQLRQDDDPMLTVVQWSAVTRILRELVSNVLAHAQAQQVRVQLILAQGRFELQVSDDGQGSEPSSWSAGLGLGGVRKRVKLLGGKVAWHHSPQGGVTCDVQVPRFSDSAAG
jgi:signal transduction histidine kinase